MLKKSLLYYSLTFNFKFFLRNKTNEVNYLQAFLSVNVSMPQVPIMNFRQALKFNPNSSVSAQLDVIDGANNQAKAVLKVSLFHSYFQFYSCVSATKQSLGFIPGRPRWDLWWVMQKKKPVTYVLPFNYHSKNASYLFTYQQLTDGQLAKYRLHIEGAIVILHHENKK